jgi:spore coat polysaccharide biosynthesis protein SpsF (cytidylyltransferase family)
MEQRFMATNPRQSVALIDLGIEADGARPRWETAMRRLDGLTLLEWSIRRLAEATLVDSIAITGLSETHSALARACLCHAKSVPSSLATPSQRAADIADKMNADWILHVHPSCPFLDPALIDCLISRGLSDPHVDFVGFSVPTSPDFSLQRLGLVAEMTSARGLTKILDDGLSDDPLDIPQLVRLHQNHFRCTWIPLPHALRNDSLCFSLETEDDWERAGTYMELIGDDISWQRLAAVADRRSLQTTRD